ncbi:ATP-binding protein [Clostridium weizhouense]|uniref:histidine kinase n=1 Tax=Clostridium weizhouense TaxID=2859781 RepID=A0ABS7AT23_9CLOT|nr:ATP-binding protein [Clostridium weizhouense]MBW6411820.1 GHKL domain-containing protein [Clostridium weizhouense]
MKNSNNEKKVHNRFYNKLLSSKYFRRSNKILVKIRSKIEKSIRFELMIVIGVCFLISFIFYNFTNNLLKREYSSPEIIYDYKTIEDEAYNLSNILESDTSLNLNQKESIENILNYQVYKNSRVYITDLDGKIVFKNTNVVEENIDIYNALKNAITITEYDGGNSVKEKVYIIPLKIQSERFYLIYSKIPSAEIRYNTIHTSNASLALALTFIIFIISFVIITNKKMKYLDEIASGLKIIANGNLNHRIDEKGRDEIKNIAYNINNMAVQIGDKIHAERIAEQTKADLITNVSHDLRTPLTSVMGYIGLVNEGRYKDKEEMNEYLNIAFNKAEKLKLLIEDLFEYTKLNNNGIKFSKEKVNLVEFLSQLIEEMIPILDENSLTIHKKFDIDKVYVNIDPTKMLRVFENLITNAIKYSNKPGEIIIGIYEEENYATIVCRNKGEHIPKQKLEKLFDRFYRVDESRSTNTGGSGLGLAISKNIVNLHKGKIWAESIGDNISFYVQLQI